MTVRRSVAAFAGLLMLVAGDVGGASELQDAIAAAARRQGLPVALVEAVVAVESGRNPTAVSSKGARGLMQLMPATAVRFGVDDPFDIEQSLQGGCAYLRWLLEHFEGRVTLALAGYNAGEASVERFGGIPPFPETQEYVRRVLDALPSRRAAQHSAPPRTAMARATTSSMVMLGQASTAEGSIVGASR